MEIVDTQLSVESAIIEYAEEVDLIVIGKGQIWTQKLLLESVASVVTKWSYYVLN